MQQQPIDFSTMTAEQATDAQLFELSSPDASLQLQHLRLDPDLKLCCDISTCKVRPYVPETPCYSVFRSLHCVVFGHPGNQFKADLCGLVC